MAKFARNIQKHLFLQLRTHKEQLWSCTIIITCDALGSYRFFVGCPIVLTKLVLACFEPGSSDINCLVETQDTSRQTTYVYQIDKLHRNLQVTSKTAFQTALTCATPVHNVPKLKSLSL